MCEGSSDLDLLSKLDDPKLWQTYLEKKRTSFPDNPHLDQYAKIFETPEFHNIIADIAEGNYRFSVPSKKLIGKYKVGKKRTVYVFKPYEMMAFRLIAHLLQQYDHLFSDNLYSFRSGYSVKTAVQKLQNIPTSKKQFGFKMDLHNYFNSIPVDRLLEDLASTIPDNKLNNLFDSILSSKKVRFHRKIILEDKGAMAGIPLAAFFANFYLRSVDEYFSNQDCTYLRYADDILVLSSDEAHLHKLQDELINQVHRFGLQINESKTKFFMPNDSLEFLGFSLVGNRVDIGENTIYKIKGRIRRSAKSIRRWMIEKNAPLKGTLKALIRHYNSKFYGYIDSEVSWNRWYFPAITTDRSLHIIDIYFQEWLRYVATGKHTKKNYEVVPYELLKECGYRSLVHEYHQYIENPIIIENFPYDD